MLFHLATPASFLLRGVHAGEAVRVAPGRRKSLRWDRLLDKGQSKAHRKDGTAQRDQESMEACSRPETGGRAKVRLPLTNHRAVDSEGARIGDLSFGRV